MSDESKSPVDQLADLLLFAPLGFALEARDLLPRLAERGRSQLRQARGQSERVVSRSRDWAGARVDDAHDEASAALSGLGLRTSGNGSMADRQSSPPTGLGLHDSLQMVPAQPKPVPPKKKETRAAPPFDVDRLALPDYDALSASHVVPRLAGMSAEELELVRQYEAGSRARKTILNKIAQLQAD